MKVLWFSNCVLGTNDSRGTGSWLYAMKNIISQKVDLYNITYSWKNSDILCNKYSDLEEFILPNYKLKNGLPSLKNIAKIKHIVDSINPDIIHIWGTERYWALLFSSGYLKNTAILEVQGLLSSCYTAYYGGLSPKEISACFGIKEFLKPNYILKNLRKDYKFRAIKSQEMIRGFEHISTQSDWTRGQLSVLLPNNRNYHKTLMPIRREFYESGKWYPKSRENFVLFCSTSYFEPFKGIHIIIKALACIKKHIPTIMLEIAGVDKNNSWLRTNGYTKFIYRLIHELDVEKNVRFVGRLNANEIATHLVETDIYINTSFVESYSVATAEALYLGVPSILAYSGAIPEFSAVKKTCIFYSPMDYIDCARKILSLLNSKEEQIVLSNNAISIMENQCSPIKVCQTQLDIYAKVIDNSNN